MVETTIAWLRTALGPDGDLNRMAAECGYRLAVQPS
jgi:hypothetical protein